MKSLPIILKELTNAILSRDEDAFAYYLDTDQGRIIPIDNRLLNPESAEEIGDKDQSILNNIIEVLGDDSGRFSEIPRLPTEIWAELIERFVSEIESPDTGLKVLNAFDKEDVLSEFENILKEEPHLLNQWGNLLNRSARIFAEEWLQSLNIRPEWE